MFEKEFQTFGLLPGHWAVSRRDYGQKKIISEGGVFPKGIDIQKSGRFPGKVS